MSRTLLFFVAVLAFMGIALGGAALSSVWRDQSDSDSFASMRDALSATAAQGSNSDDGAVLTIATTGTKWSGNLYKLNAAGVATSYVHSFSGVGALSISGGSGSTLSVKADATGALTVTQGSATETCPVSFTLDGSTYTYEC